MLVVKHNLKSLMFASLVVSSVSNVATAKGLEELSQNNPETAAPAEADPDAAAEPAAETAATATAPSAMSQSLAEKLFVATSFGWVSTSKSEGNWKTVGGMSDFLVGYVLPVDLGAAMKLSGTYRYAPVAVTGDEDDRSYRGVWESHYFGTLLHYTVNDKVRAVGTGELGFTKVSLNSTDGIPAEDKHAKSGGAVVLGGGADWKMLETNAFTVGPRLYAGFGSFTTIQLGASASFLF